jgi:ABC-type dipeptide/oligopeptide/nickel transport system permease subunit
MMALSTGKTILEISSLGFLGIGVAPPMPELGSMISEGIAYMRSTPRLIVIPGAVLSLLVFSFLLLGNQDRNGKKELPT